MFEKVFRSPALISGYMSCSCYIEGMSKGVNVRPFRIAILQHDPGLIEC